MKINKERLVESLNQNLSLREIAKNYGTTVYYVRKNVKEFGLSIKSPGMNSTAETICGRTFDLLKVIKIDGKTPDGKSRMVLCECFCGKLSRRVPSELLRSRGIKMCDDCRKKYISKLNWKGSGEISGDMFVRIKTSASRRGYEFSISNDYIWKLFIKQNKKCALSGMELAFSRTRKNETTASLDRINSSIGYIEGNVQWVHKDVNRMKMAMTEEKFIFWCDAVSQHMRTSSN